MFERENAFYQTHQAEYHDKYLNKWLVIAGESLFGAYNTPKEAIQTALQRFRPGEFMIHTPAHDGLVIKIGPSIYAQPMDDQKKQKTEPAITVSDGELKAFTYAWPYGISSV